MDKPTMVRKSGGMLYFPALDVTLSSDGGGEYTMPDYYPEIRRVVSVSARALPDSKFLSGNVLEFGGTLAFSLLYIGDDGSLVCVPYACEYQGSTAVPPEISGGGDITVDTVADAPQCRVLAPRSISLKSKLRSRVYADGEKEYVCQSSDTDGGGLSPADERTIERLSEKAATRKKVRVSTTGSVSGDMRDGRGAKPVSCDAWVTVTDAVCKNDTVTVRGEISLQCIAFGADGLYCGARGRLPFEEIIPADGAREGDSVSAWGRAASVSVSAAEDGGTIHAEVEYDLDAEWYRAGEALLISDAYSTQYELETRSSKTEILAPVCCTSSALTQSASVNLQSVSPDAYLIDAVAAPVFEKAECHDGKIVFSGSCPVKAYIASSGDVICEELQLPLKFEARAECEAQREELLWRANAAVSDMTARLDGGKLSATCELYISAGASAKKAYHPVTETVIDRSTRRECAGMVMKICYPPKGESIWETAKRCHASGAELEKINKLRRDDVSDGTPLIITVK